MFIEAIILLALIAIIAYKKIQEKANFFVDRNIKYDRYFPIFGTFRDVFLRRKTFLETTKDVYQKFNGEKIVGIFDNGKPVFLVRDPEIIKQICVKEFDHFTNHRQFFEDTNAGLFSHALFTLRDQKWKDMRSTLSPAFTGSKMRLMFDLIREVSEQGTKFLKTHKDVKTGIELDVKKFFTLYTNDVIASAAFGIKIDSLADENNEFYQMGKVVTSFTILKTLKFIIFLNFRFISKLFKIRLFAKKYDDYFIKLIKDAMLYRKEHNIVRNDVINILMDAKGLNGIISKSSRNWTDEELTSQSFFFFFAGFETVSATTSFAAYELMANPETQKRLIREIEEVKKSLNGKAITYEVLSGMKYLDAVVSETLRKWPIPSIDRQCNKEFVLEDPEKGKIVIKDGEGIVIPIAGIHYDPKIYPNPEVFDPNRFYEKNGSINEFNYMPFGVGPRKCIASRFGLMETKSILYYLLCDFTFRKGEKTQVPIILENSGFQVKAKGGCWIKLVENNTEEHVNWMNS